MAGFKGGAGMGGNMQNLMKQAQKLQQEMQETEKLLDDWEIVGTSGGEAVVVYMNAWRCSKTSSWRRSTTAIKRRTRSTRRRWRRTGDWGE